MLPSLTLHSATNVAVTATLSATMALIFDSRPRSTASVMVSLTSDMAGMVRHRGFEAMIFCLDCGAHAARVLAARSPDRQRASGPLPDSIQDRLRRDGRGLQGRARAAWPPGRGEVPASLDRRAEGVPQPVRERGARDEPPRPPEYGLRDRLRRRRGAVPGDGLCHRPHAARLAACRGAARPHARAGPGAPAAGWPRPRARAGDHPP